MQLDLKALGEQIADLIAEATDPLVNRIRGLEERQPERGEKGPKGDPGPVAEPVLVADVVAELVRSDLLASVLDMYVEERVGKHFVANPLRDGKDGESGQKGDPGKDGAAGKDGSSITLDDVTPMIDSAVTKWALDFERRAQDVLQRAVDKIPAPAAGKDGRDAFALEDIDIAIADDGRTVTLAFARDGERVERQVKTSAVVYRGVFVEAAEYAANDAVTWAGSLWIAQKDAPDGKPDDGKGAWRLSVKKGRDGRDGPAGKDFTPPKPVKAS